MEAAGTTVRDVFTHFHGNVAVTGAFFKFWSLEFKHSSMHSVGVCVSVCVFSLCCHNSPHRLSSQPT